MTSLGEIATYLPIPGAFTSYATRLIDPSLGFAMGWIYWFSWAITYGLELTATGLIIQYWNSSISVAIFIAVFWVVITILNLLPVNFYGELEFWLSTVKVCRPHAEFEGLSSNMVTIGYYRYWLHSLWNMYRCWCWTTGIPRLS